MRTRITAGLAAISASALLATSACTGSSTGSGLTATPSGSSVSSSFSRGAVASPAAPVGSSGNTAGPASPTGAAVSGSASAHGSGTMSASGAATSGSTKPSGSAAVGGANYIGPAVTITFMEAMSSGTPKTALATLVATFERANPNVKVILDAQPDYPTLLRKEAAAAAAGKPPTIGQAYEDWAAKFADSQQIDQLASMPGAAAQLSTFYSGIKTDLYLPDGKLWMWPFNKSVVIAYYNQTLLKSKNLPVPTTWDQFAADSKAVAGNGTVGIAIDPGNSSKPAGGTVMFDIMAAGYGSPLYDAKTGKPTFDGPGAVQALQLLVDMKNSGALSVGSNNPGPVALGDGKGLFDVASVASYHDDLQAIGGKFPMGTALVPAGPKGRANQLAGTNIVMFAKAGDDQKKAAWAFLQWLDQPTQQAFWSTTSGYLPVTAQALPLMKDALAKAPYRSTAASDLQYATAEPAYAYVQQTDGILATALGQALAGQGSPQALLTTAQQKALAVANSAG